MGQRLCNEVRSKYRMEDYLQTKTKTKRSKVSQFLDVNVPLATQGHLGTKTKKKENKMMIKRRMKMVMTLKVMRRRRRRIMRRWRRMKSGRVEVLLYVHRNHRLIRDGSPGRPPPLSHSSERVDFIFIGAGSWMLPIVSRQPNRVATGRQNKTNKKRGEKEGKKEKG